MSESDFVNPAQLAIEIVRYIGERVSELGQPIRRLHTAEICEAIEVNSEMLVSQVFEELASASIVQFEERSRTFDSTVYISVNLTLQGWQEFQSELRGEIAGDYGFLAMQYDESELEDLVSSVLNPIVEETTGYRLIEMRDVPEAGIIDNIMRVRIRDSRFVIADLTHGNNGAYWEAGYAEGLGKPVIYICEQGKFDSNGTHFDTNHCTTVPWSLDDVGEFKGRISATLKQSLNLGAVY